MSFTSKYTSIFFPFSFASSSSFVNSIFDIISSAVPTTFAPFAFGVSGVTISIMPLSIISNVVVNVSTTS